LSPLKGTIDPEAAELYVNNLAGFSAWQKSVGHASAVTDRADGLMNDANSLIAKESGAERIICAEEWGSERGFYSAAVEQEWEDLKEHAGEIVKDMAKDAAIFTVLQFIPVVDVLADLYMLGSIAADIIGSVADIASAEEMARKATTAVELQRAAATLASALSASARKVATALAAHVAAHGTAALGGKAFEKFGNRKTSGGEPSGGEPAPSGPRPKDPWDPTQQPPPSPSSATAVPPRLEVHQGDGLGDGVARGNLSSVPAEGPPHTEPGAQPVPVEVEVEAEQYQQGEVKAASGARPGEVVMQSQGTPIEASGRGKRSGGSPGEVNKPTRTSGDNRLGGPNDTRYSPLSRKLVVKLEKDIPALKDAHLSILKRGSGPGIFEERMFTSGKSETFQAFLRDGTTKVQIDDIGPDGAIVESKMRTDLSALRKAKVEEYMTEHARRELDFETNRHLEPNIRRDAVRAADRYIDMIKTSELEKFEDQLVRQQQLIVENGLPNGEWITDSAEAAMKIRTIIQVRGLDMLRVRYVKR
jgi:hypothetical protein